MCTASDAGNAGSSQRQRVASKALSDIERYALTHDQDDQPRTHRELDDNR
ncbi:MULTISPECIES: hypothetical protein [unclassified Streptomyces]|nr:hypothetical protein [Streptomyces sp. AmelKG-E11A]